MPKKVPPYSKLARIYDIVMQHVNYRRWYNYVLDVACRYELDPDRILELACGTGTVAWHLSQKGYTVIGMDLCYGMLEAAAEKRPGEKLLVQGDMSLLPFKGTFDLVVCLYDSMNYLMEPELITRTLEDAHRLLTPGGLFIFDVCTEFNSLEYFSHYDDRETGETYSYERESRYHVSTKIQTNRFRIRLEENGKMHKFTELHEQRIYLLKDIDKLIEDTGKYYFEIFDGFTLDPPTARSCRVHYVLKPVTG